MSRSGTLALRCRWYLRALGNTHALIRVSDRVIAVALLSAFGTMLAVVPVTWQLGQSVYDAEMHRSSEQTATRRAVNAVVTEIQSGTSLDFDSPMRVHAQWPQGGHQRTGDVTSPVSVAVGSRLTVWLDERGQVVEAPVPPAEAMTTAVGLALIVGTLTVFASTLAVISVSWGVNKHRSRAWERSYVSLIASDGRRHYGHN